MSIAVQKIKRAIADMPTGGMQTGKRHIKLEYSDAQRAIAEIEGLAVERDTLAAQVEVLRRALTDIRHSPDDHCAEIATDALDSTPSACLAQVKVEVVQKFASELASKVVVPDSSPQKVEFYKAAIRHVLAFAEGYAERIRQGGAG